MINAAIIGLGWWGKTLVESVSGVSDDIRFVAGTTRSLSDEAKAFAKEHNMELRASFEQKQKKAANFDAYRAQLDEIERSFGTMLRQLPGKTEIPNLLVDISQTGLAAGLQEELFQPSDDVTFDTRDHDGSSSAVFRAK